MNANNFKSLVLFVPVSLLLSVTGFAQQNTLLQDISNRYTSLKNVVNMPAGRVMGSGNAVDVDSQGSIWVFERCGANTCTGSDLDPVLKFSPERDLLDSFGAGMPVFPHGIVVDEDDNLWEVAIK